MHVSLRGLAGGLPGLAVREGELRTAAAARTAAQVVCPGFRFTAVGVLWRGPDTGVVHTRIQSAKLGEAFGRVQVVHNEPDEGPSPGFPDYLPGHQAADLLWTGARRCIRLSLQLPGGDRLSDLRAAFVNTSGTAGRVPRTATVERTPGAKTGSVRSMLATG